MDERDKRRHLTTVQKNDDAHTWSKQLPTNHWGHFGTKQNLPEHPSPMHQTMAEVLPKVRTIQGHLSTEF